MRSRIWEQRSVSDRIVFYILKSPKLLYKLCRAALRICRVADQLLPRRFQIVKETVCFELLVWERQFSGLVIFSEVTNSIGIALGFIESHVLLVQVAIKIILTYIYSACFAMFA